VSLNSGLTGLLRPVSRVIKKNKQFQGLASDSQKGEGALFIPDVVFVEDPHNRL